MRGRIVGRLLKEGFSSSFGGEFRVEDKEFEDVF